MRLGLSLACVLFMISSAVNGQLHGDWIDPNDPLAFDPTTIERDYSKYLERKNQQEQKDPDNDGAHLPCPTPVSCPEHPAPSCDREKQEIEDLKKIVDKQPIGQMPYYKRFVATFLSQVKSAHLGTYADVNYFDVKLELSDGEIQVLENFVHESDDRRVRDAHAILDNVMKSVRQIDIPEDAVTDWQSGIKCISSVVIAIACSAIVINLQWRNGMPWMRIIGSIFVVLFLISVPWNWWHLYQMELAKRMSKSQMDAPVECRPRDMDFFQYLMSGLSLQDKCEEFYRSLHVDPWVEIPPTKAIAVTVSRFVLEPLEYLGGSLGKMIKACLSELPAHLWPVGLAFMLIVFIMLLIMSFGYRIRVLYLFGLEPSTPAIQGTDRQMIEQVEAMRKQITDLQQVVEDHTKSVEEQLGRPQPQALLSIQPGELESQTGAPYQQTGEATPRRMAPSASSTPYYSGSGDVAASYAASHRVHPTGSKPTRSGVSQSRYATVSTPGGHQEKDESHIEDLDFGTPDEESMSHMFSPERSRRAGEGGGRRKKIPSSRTLSDSSIATQCGHTREEDKIAAKSRHKTFRDHDQELDHDLHCPTPRGDPISDRTVPGVVQSSFDSLAHNTDLTSPKVEEVGSQPGNIRPVESSDDSDLEIIEEDPENK